ncbi:acyl-CoA dehydrogenase NM domain-like protein [Zopfia rhizophila CBS 207.26]|uniref:Acyl-CoA dehydrogenase NM domain-like protein n=1 Tax=Zopfia rhizophila CBS 207.26 TaxID=1314779 RepID=A0A6A6E9X3_9PEZI|nr:acyl-CoA dehydrogenase NM domain-like protein [Zopfia rhizophila CBS 207.26]
MYTLLGLSISQVSSLGEWRPVGAKSWRDPLSGKSLFTPEELDIQRTARAYCQERLLPNAYGDEYYDPKILKEMGELGLLGATMPSHGCAGVSSVASGFITREVGRVGFGYRSGMSVQSSQQKDKILFNIRAKTWITNSPIADLILVWAKLATTGRIQGFLVERDRCPPGTIETSAIRHKSGLRASITSMIQLDDCPVSEENMLQVEGLNDPFSCLNSARYGISTYALDRKQFKNPLAKYQLVQKKLSDALTDAAYGTMISIVKRQNCDRALIGARALQEVFGGNAASDEYHIGRHVANLFVTQTYWARSDIHSLIIGRGIVGMQAFY